MTQSTIQQVREAKAELLKLFKHHADFAGAGIGQQDGRLVVQVNWRTLPSDFTPPSRIGNVEVRHQEVGNVRRQSGKPSA